MKSFLQEFKAFAIRGSVVDLAVGIVIGAAFQKIVSSLVDNIIMPSVGIFLGGIRVRELSVAVGEANIQYGVFLQNTVDFIIIAFAIFIAVRIINSLRRSEDAKPKSPPEEIQLLREIRDAVKK